MTLSKICLEIWNIMKLLLKRFVKIVLLFRQRPQRRVSKDYITFLINFLSICQFFARSKLYHLKVASEWRLLPTEFYSQPDIALHILSFDEIWKTILSRRGWDGNALLPLLTSLVGCIRSLPHSNASTERTFSLLPDISNKKRNRLSNESVNALTVAKSATKRVERSAPTFIDDQLSSMSASNLYKAPKKKANLLALYSDSESMNENLCYFVTR